MTKISGQFLISGQY